MQNIKSVGLKEARVMVRAMIEAAEKSEGLPMAVAVVDRLGDPICIERMDGSMRQTDRMAVIKCLSALRFLRDTIDSRRIQKELDLKPYEFCDQKYSTIPGGVLLKGKDGSIVGAVGASGRAPLAPMGDEELARVGAKAFEDMMA